MDIKSLTLKNQRQLETGEYYFDLTQPVFTYDSTHGIRAVHYVLPEQEGRLDKICELYWGNCEYLDALCIVNNIFNPFSVPSGTLLVIPNITSGSALYKRPTIAKYTPATFKIQQGVNNTNSVRADRLKKKQIKASQPIAPNRLQPGDVNKKYSQGTVILGTYLDTK